MRRPSLLTSVLIGVVLAGVLAWYFAGQHAPESSSIDRNRAGRAESVAPTADAARRSTGAVPVVPRSGKLEDQIDAGLVFDVRVLRAEDDQPLAGAEVSTGAPSDGGERAVQITGADGITRWRSQSGDEEFLAGRAPGRRAVDKTFSLRSGPPPRVVVLRMEIQHDVVVRLVDAQGQAWKPSSLGIDARAARSISVALSSSCAPAGENLDVRLAPAFRARPVAWDADRFEWNLEIRDFESTCVHAVVGEFVLAARTIDTSTSELELTVEPALFERVSAPFDVRVVSAEDGRPLAQADVVARTPVGLESTVTTDVDGRARFGSFLAGAVVLSVRATGFQRAEVRVQRPMPNEVVVHMSRGRIVSGIVVDGDGRPVSGTGVGIYHATQLGTIGAPIEVVASDAAGHFEFLGMSSEELVLFGLGHTNGEGYLPPRETLPLTARLIDTGIADVDVRVRALDVGGEPADH